VHALAIASLVGVAAMLNRPPAGRRLDVKIDK